MQRSVVTLVGFRESETRPKLVRVVVYPAQSHDESSLFLMEMTCELASPPRYPGTSIGSSTKNVSA
jgi:hypothetical protein